LSSNDSATVIDIPLDCLPTNDPSQGSTCGGNTTAKALVPGNSDDQLLATREIFLP